MSKTIEFFYEISKIPRESGNEKEIANYLCEFAKKRKLYYEKDKYNNVIIKKKTTNKMPIILQAHMDMVCEKDSKIKFDFEKDSIEVIEENGYLKANGTTLGADNGIGIAQILNILDSQSEYNIEAIFTVSEETSMIGAEKIDLSKLEGKSLINLDGFEKNTIIVESASFFDIVLKSRYQFNKSDEKNLYKISLSGLIGGHSGFDINKNRGNSSIILAEFLKEIKNIQLQDYIGGTKFNVIPSNAEAIFTTNESIEEIKSKLKEFEKKQKNKYRTLEIKIENIREENTNLLNNKDSAKFLESISSFKHGIFAKNEREEVTTSINLGIVNLKEQTLKIGMRSSKTDEERECLEYIKKYSKNNNLEFSILGSQPGFETSEKSSLVEKIKNAYKKIKQNEVLTVKSVHITVEAGFFKEKIPELEAAIISPEILNAHTTKESVNLESIYKCDKWLEEILRQY